LRRIACPPARRASGTAGQAGFRHRRTLPAGYADDAVKV